MKRKMLLISLVLLLAVSLVAIGCPAPASPEEVKPIKIGASLALTGKYSWTGERMKEGYKIWVTQINERGYSSGLEWLGHTEPGLIDGRPVELIIYDDRSDPATGVKLYHKLITDDKVDLLLGPYSSAVTKAISTVVEKAQVPTFTSAASDPGIWRGKNLQWIVQGLLPTYDYHPYIAEIGAKYGAKTAALVYEDTAFPTSLAETLREHLEEKGIEVVLFEAYPKGITDWTPILSKVMALKPDIVGLGGYMPDSIGLTKAAEAIKATPGLFYWTVGTYAPDYAKAVGDAAYAMTGELLWAPVFTTPGNVDFVEAYERLIGTPIVEQVTHTGMGMLAGQLLEIAVKMAGTIDREAVRDMMYEMEVETVLGPYGVMPLESVDSGLQFAQKGLIGQWQKLEPGVDTGYKTVVGEYVLEIIWPDKYKTADTIWPHPGWD